jgi:hypothetical protein
MCNHHKAGNPRIASIALPCRFRGLATFKRSDNNRVSMRHLIFILLLFLLLILPVSVPAGPVPAYTYYTTPVSHVTAVVYCSGWSADTADDMGRLYIRTIPPGASIVFDGSLWAGDECAMASPTWPFPCMVYAPEKTPVTRDVETGPHSLSLSLDGYTDYVANVNICSRQLTIAEVTLVATTPAPTVVAYHPTEVAMIPYTTTPPTFIAVTTTPTTAVTATATTAAPTTAVMATAIPAATATGTIPAASVAPAALAAGSPAPSAGTGSLSVTTTPSGATVFIDGVQRGISPTTIPGLAPGDHTLLLRLDGYEDLTAPVTITAGQTATYTTGLTASATMLPALPVTKKTPGFGVIAGFAAVGAMFLIQKRAR